MNWYCAYSGIGDEHTVDNEDSTCNSMPYARFDNGVWKCFENELEETSESCVDESGELTTCKSGGGSWCFRNVPAFTAMKQQREAMCPGTYL